MKKTSKKSKNCTIGVNCRSTCINKNKQCRVEVRPVDKQKIAKAAKALKEPRPQLKNTKSLFSDKVLTIEGPTTELGRGAYGVVVGNDRLALKTLKRTGKASEAKLFREVELQEVAASLGIAPRVVSFSKNQILMKLADGKAVEDLTATMQRTERASYKAKKNAALLSLHKLGISHNDPHIGNTFYDLKTEKLSFIDFGLATRNVPSDLFLEYKTELTAYISTTFDQVFSTSADYTSWLKSNP